MHTEIVDLLEKGMMPVQCSQDSTTAPPAGGISNDLARE